MFFPDVFVFDRNFETPRSWNSAISWEQEFIPNYAFLFKANYVETDNITRFINRNDAVFGAPWSSGLEPGGSFEYLAEGDELIITQSAVVLEQLISKYLFNAGNSDGEGDEE